MADLRVLLVDDEPLALDLLRTLLQRIDNIEVVGECRNGYEAIDGVVNLCPDVVFLDIQMPGLNGFEVVKALQPETMPLIVFVTAYDEYAVDAFDVHAVDYVLKPPTIERLARSIERVFARAQPKNMSPDLKSSIMGAIDRIEQQAGRSEDQEQETSAGKLLFRDGRAVHIVDQEKIDWVDAAGDYMCLHVDGETRVARITMKELETLLSEEIFARIHRSTIVNLQRVEKVTPLSKGECTLRLAHGVELKVSRNYADSVKSRLKIG